MEQGEAREILKKATLRFKPTSDVNDQRPMVTATGEGLTLEVINAAGLPGVRNKTGGVSQNEKSEGFKGYVEPVLGSIGLGDLGGVMAYNIGGRENLDYLKNVLEMPIKGYGAQRSPSA